MSLKKILWTPMALESLQEVYDFLLNKWGNDVAENFLDLTENRITQIKKHPSIAPVINEKGYRKLIIHKNASIFYINEGAKSSILLIHDNRQNPEELAEKLS